MYTAEVLVDMDGVLADAHRGFAVAIERTYPNIQPADSNMHFFPLEGYRAQDHQAGWNVLTAPGFFANLPLMDGALKGWERMLSLGFDPRICSSPLDKSPTCKDEKLAWLEMKFAPYFGATVVDRAVITHNKAAVGGVALIDDNPTIKNSDYAQWQHIVFGRPFNRHVIDRPRLNDWHDRRLGSMLLNARERYTIARSH